MSIKKVAINKMSNHPDLTFSIKPFSNARVTYETEAQAELRIACEKIDRHNKMKNYFKPKNKNEVVN